MAKEKKDESIQFVRFFGPLLDALRSIGGSAKPDEAIDRVAAQLGNTRAVCRRCYIHPQVIDSWERGVLADQTKVARRLMRKPAEGLDAEEALVLKWLKSSAAE